jgi:CheY-like chemotaxis protein
MNRVLVVDDSIVDRMLVAGLLKTHPEFDVDVAESAKEALRRCAGSGPDIIVTDLIMPEMDGLDLVKEVRIRFPHIPVVLMTAYGNEAIAVQALEAGAASYVPKARQAEQLVETVRRVVTRSIADRRRDVVAECMVELKCRFTLDNDPALIEPLIDTLQHRVATICISDPTERVRTMLALEEALLTAMYEGNLEITEAELADAKRGPEAGRLTSLVEQRRGLPELCKRQVHLEARITSEGAGFRVRSDGDGLKRSALSRSSDGDCFENGRGRGRMLIRSLMDAVVYNERGCEVTLVKEARKRTGTTT